MDSADLRRGAAAALLLAAPAAAQEPRFASAVPPVELIAPTGAGLAPTPAVAPARPGLFGWRQKHAERKRHRQEAFTGLPHEFNEWPHGSALYAHGLTQVANAEAARMTFNHYDFAGNTDALNERGRDKLAAVTARLPASFDPVIVERTPWEPGLAERRRLSLLGQFASGPFPVPPERVAVGRPAATPLRGVEAQVIDAGRMGQTASGGQGGGTDAGGVRGPSRAAWGEGPAMAPTDRARGRRRPCRGGRPGVGAVGIIPVTRRGGEGDEAEA
jgi:hypothetical protein